MMQNQKMVRVRFAPSPTGHLHVGNARTAILNWLFARHSNGALVLRIEDTDAERSDPAYYDSLLTDLKWLGIDWDEGPDRGGEYGPYRQSERFQIYQDYAGRLLAAGQAFRCFCSAEEIQAKADAALSQGLSLRYDGTCHDLSDAQIRAFEAAGRESVVRFRVREDAVSFIDVVRGEVRFARENVNDFVLLRADGSATYNFAAAIDDTLMAVTHVVRGEDHLSNTPKQVLLYRALDLSMPEFAHIPMILGQDRRKLSKRHGDNQMRQYRERGYLPEALVNFLSLLSWSSPSGDELLSVERLIAEFDLSRLSKSSAIFDPEKFDWMNGCYLRNADFDAIVTLARPFFQAAGYDLSDPAFVRKCIAAVIQRANNLQELADRCAIFFRDEVEFENESLIQNPDSKRVFRQFLAETDTVAEWSGAVFKDAMKAVQTQTGVRGKDLWLPIRMAITGTEHGPELPAVVEILGMEKSRRFVENALKV